MEVNGLFPALPKGFQFEQNKLDNCQPSKTLVELGSVCGQFLTVYNIVHHIIYKLIHVYLRDCWKSVLGIWGRGVFPTSSFIA